MLNKFKVLFVALLCIYLGACENQAIQKSVDLELDSLKQMIGSPHFRMSKKEMDVLASILGRWNRPHLIGKPGTILWSHQTDSIWEYCVDPDSFGVINPKLLTNLLLQKGLRDESKYFSIMGDYVKVFRCQDPPIAASSFYVLARMEYLSDTETRDSLFYLLEDLRIQIFTASSKLIEVAVENHVPRSIVLNEMKSGCNLPGACRDIYQVLSFEPTECQSSAMLFCGDLKKAYAALGHVQHVIGARTYF